MVTGLFLYLRMHREFTISNRNDKFTVRFGRYFIFVLLICAVLLTVGAIRQSWDYNFLVIFVLVLGTVFCIYKSMTALYKIVFDMEARQVTVDILQFDKIKHRHIIPFEAFEVTVKTNYLKPGVPNVLRVYANGKLLIKQEQTFGWSTDDLYDIEDFAREVIR
jgi:hypothetical protein